MAVRNEETHALFSVKYNSYRNIGFLYEEQDQKEEALHYLLKVNKLFPFLECFYLNYLNLRLVLL